MARATARRAASATAATRAWPSYQSSNTLASIRALWQCGADNGTGRPLEAATSSRAAMIARAAVRRGRSPISCRKWAARPFAASASCNRAWSPAGPKSSDRATPASVRPNRSGSRPERKAEGILQLVVVPAHAHVHPACHSRDRRAGKPVLRLQRRCPGQNQARRSHTAARQGTCDGTAFAQAGAAGTG